MGDGVKAWATLDKLDDTDGEPMSLEQLQERLFAPLAKHYVGITLSGAQHLRHYQQSGPWGAELQLPSTEQLQMRVSPNNLVKMLREGQGPYHVILVIRRRLRSSTFDATRFCLLWHRDSAAQRITEFTKMEQSGLSMGGSNCSLVPLRIFCNHDATRKSSRYHGSEYYATINDQGFQIIRPHAYSVLTPTQFGIPVVPAPGASQWSITAACLGFDLGDSRRQPLQVIPKHEWINQNKRLSGAVRKWLNERDPLEPRFSHACANAFLATGALDCLGFVTFLGSDIYEGAWPDALHVPEGIPLVIAMCTRLATSHCRFGMGAKPTPTDEFSNDRFRACCEPLWHAFDDRGNLALDLAIQRAMAEASEELGSDLVQQFVQVYRRSGQSCISRSFGLCEEDLASDEFPASHIRDPITAAYAAVAKAELGERGAIQNDGIDLYSPDLCLHRTRTQKTILVFVMSSVERFLRLGNYGGLDDTTGQHLEKMQRRHIVTAGELRSKVTSGLAATLAREAGAESEEQEMQLIEGMKTRLEAILLDCSDETKVRCPTFEEILDFSKIPDVFDIDDSDLQEADPPLDKECMELAIRTLKVLFSQGPVAMTGLFGLEATLFSEHSVVPCADCNNRVNLLDTFVLQSSCACCSRPRCMSCSHNYYQKKKTSTEPTGCLRCKKK